MATLSVQCNYCLRDSTDCLQSVSYFIDIYKSKSQALCILYDLWRVGLLLLFYPDEFDEELREEAARSLPPAKQLEIAQGATRNHKPAENTETGSAIQVTITRDGSEKVRTEGVYQCYS